MDFSAICRTCIKATTNISLNPIFFSEDTHEKFSAAFYSCTGVQVKFNDGLPQNMCTACMKQFNDMLKFRKQCKQAETQLLKLKTDLESENFNISTIEEPTILFTKERLAETDLQNGSKEMSIKSEYKIINIKKESTEIDIDEDQPLKYWVNKNIGNISLLESNNLKVNDATAEDTSEPEYFNEETVLFRDENSFNTNKTLTQNNESIQCEIYSRRPHKNNHIPVSDRESHISEQISDSSITEEKPIEIPYIITKTDTTKTARVVCKLCQKELSIRSIDSHMMRRHPGADERKVKCDLCDKYVMRDKLNRHRVMMHGNVGVKCGYCKAEFNSKEALLDHVATCTAKNKKRKINDSGRAIAECDICKMTMQRASLSKHKAVKHAGLRPVCEHCGKSFGNKFRLNEHYRAKHGYEKFKCSYCDFRSAGIMAMRNHERRHRGEKPYVCETCGAKFHAAYLLMQHKHSHNTEKLVKCDLCPASFKANNNLHMHKLTCHSKSYYSCTLCARSYKCRYYAVKHVRVAHSVSEAPEVIKLMTP